IAFWRDNVGVDVLIRTENREAVYAQFGDFPTSRSSTTHTGLFLVHNSSLPVRLFLLGFFQTDLFVSIPNTLALVRLGTAECANLGGHLTHYLFIDALDHNFGLG